MTKDDVDFQVWFDTLVMHVWERTGIRFEDADSVSQDYDSGANVFDVIDDICKGYGE